MKYLLAVALVIAVASAGVIKPIPASEQAQIQEIIAAIQSPSTDPATAVALEQMLLDVLGLAPVSVGPAIVNPVGPAGDPVHPIVVAPAIVPEPHPISIGPAIIPFPLPDGGAVAEDVVAPAPAVIAPAPVADAATPLVQIIVNVNPTAAESSPIAPAPVILPNPIRPEPVHVVDDATLPVHVVDVAPEAVQVVDFAPIVPTPVHVVEIAPVPAEPVLIGTPVLPSPAVILPEELN